MKSLNRLYEDEGLSFRQRDPPCQGKESSDRSSKSPSVFEVRRKNIICKMGRPGSKESVRSRQELESMERYKRSEYSRGASGPQLDPMIFGEDGFTNLTTSHDDIFGTDAGAYQYKQKRSNGKRLTGSVDNNGYQNYLARDLARDLARGPARNSNRHGIAAPPTKNYCLDLPVPSPDSPDSGSKRAQSRNRSVTAKMLEANGVPLVNKNRQMTPVTANIKQGLRNRRQESVERLDQYYRDDKSQLSGSNHSKYYQGEGYLEDYKGYKMSQEVKNTSPFQGISNRSSRRMLAQKSKDYLMKGVPQGILQSYQEDRSVENGSQVRKNNLFMTYDQDSNPHQSPYNFRQELKSSESYEPYEDSRSMIDHFLRKKSTRRETGKDSIESRRASGMRKEPSASQISVIEDLKRDYEKKMETVSRNRSSKLSENRPTKLNVELNVFSVNIRGRQTINCPTHCPNCKYPLQRPETTSQHNKTKSQGRQPLQALYLNQGSSQSPLSLSSLHPTPQPLISIQDSQGQGQLSQSNLSYMGTTSPLNKAYAKKPGPPVTKPSPFRPKNNHQKDHQKDHQRDNYYNQAYQPNQYSYVHHYPPSESLNFPEDLSPPRKAHQNCHGLNNHIVNRQKGHIETFKENSYNQLMQNQSVSRPLSKSPHLKKPLPRGLASQYRDELGYSQSGLSGNSSWIKR